MRHRYWTAALLLALSSASIAQNAVQLSLADAIKMAQAQSPSARAAAARLANASAQLRSARAPLNPTLALAHGWGTETGGLDEDILLTQTLQLPGKRQPAVRAALLGRDAAIADQAQSGLDLTFAVRTAYYEALRADADYQLASDALDVAKKFDESAQIRFQAGDIPRSNVVRSGIELIQSQEALNAADTERTNRYAELRSEVGLPVETPVVLTDKLSFTPADYKLDELHVRALNNRPDLRAAKLQRDSLASSVKAARAESQPDPFVEYRHSTIDPSTGGSSIRVGIELPFLDLGRNRANVDAAKAALAEQQAILDDQTRVANLEVESAYYILMQARQVVESFKPDRLSRAKELLDMAQLGYEKGASSYLELLDAQQVYRSEQADYSRALADYNIAAAALVRAIGGEIK
jgi:outer membrane protein TolC